jgi:hypothetical protein
VIFGFAVAIKWDLRDRVWFWVTIVLIAALHAVAIRSVSWTTNWFSPYTLSGIASADIWIIMVVVWAVERVIAGPRHGHHRSG